MSLFVWYFGTRRRYADVPHHTILLGPRYRELLSDIFDRKVLAQRLQPLSAPADRHRSLARARGVRRVLCPVAGAAPGQRNRLAPKGRTLPPRDGAPSKRNRAARSRSECRDLADDDATGLPGPAPVVPRSGVRARASPVAERLVPAAQSQRGGRKISISSAPAPIRARDCLAFFLPPAYSTRSCPMPSHLPDTDTSLASDLVACRALLRGGSRTFFAASHVLPRRVAEPATALYAFCRLADDAVDLHGGKLGALAHLRERLQRAYRRASAACARRSRLCRRGRAFRHSQGVARSAARGAGLGCQWPPLRRPLSADRLRRARRRLRRRHDVDRDGRAFSAGGGASVRSRCCDAAYQHRARCRRGRARWPNLSSAWMAARGRDRSGCMAGTANVLPADRRMRAAPIERGRRPVCALERRHCPASARVPAGNSRRTASLCRDRPRGRAVRLRFGVSPRGRTVDAQGAVCWCRQSPRSWNPALGSLRRRWMKHGS